MSVTDRYASAVSGCFNDVPCSLQWLGYSLVFFAGPYRACIPGLTSVWSPVDCLCNRVCAACLCLQGSLLRAPQCLDVNIAQP